MSASAMCQDQHRHRSPDRVAAEGIAALPVMLEIICRIAGLGVAAVAQIKDDAWKVCSVKDDVGFGLRAHDVFRIDAVPWQEMHTHQRPIVIDDAGDDQAIHRLSDSECLGFRSCIAFPITLSQGACSEPSAHSARCLPDWTRRRYEGYSGNSPNSSDCSSTRSVNRPGRRVRRTMTR